MFCRFPNENLHFKITSSLTLLFCSISLFTKSWCQYLSNWFFRLDVNGVLYCRKEYRKRIKMEAKHAILSPFSCSIAHARIASYAFVNPESLRLNWTIVQLNCDLGGGGTSATSHSFLFYSCHTHTGTHRTQTQMNQMCCITKPRGHESEDNCRDDIVPEVKQANGQIIRLWGYQRRWCNHTPYLGFLRQQPHDLCQAIVSWRETGVMSDKKPIVHS